MEKKRIKREFSAGGVVYQKKAGKILWLVIKPKGSDKWRLPKGWIEEGEKSIEAAVREVEEEAGIKSKVLEKIGDEKYFFVLNGERIFKIVVFYLMEFLEEKKEGFDWETEAIEWLAFEEAKEKLAFKSEKEMLEKGEQLIVNGK